MQDKNIHSGHRARLLETVSRVGLENVSEIQVLEYILFYIFPRGDTNPLAHRLLEKFGSISNILNANENELVSVEGIGKRSAKQLTMLPEIFNLYSYDMLGKKLKLFTMSSLCDFCETLLRLKMIEELYIVALNVSGQLIRKECLARGSINFVGIPTKTITNFINSTNAAYIVMAHNHPGGSASASSQDIKGTQFLKEVVNINGSKFIEHFIVGNDGIFGIENNKMLRSYIIDGVNILK